MPKSQLAGRQHACLLFGIRGGGLASLLEGAGFEVASLDGEGAVRAALDRRPSAIVLVGPNVGEGQLQSLIASVAAARAGSKVVVVGAAARLQDAVDAMQAGASDFLAPPFSADTVLPRLKRLLAELPATATVPAARTPDRHGLTGESPTMARVYSAIARISRYKTNLLLLGESGSGKELIARALHATGPRKNHAFVPLNCATLGREILENELFGHERGAFTGANDRKKGLFELADGGTLFLDEVGELDPSTQAKLLRVIERNEFRRVGGTGKIKVDVSIIAATNRDLEEAVESGRFREDLYYRLKVVTLRVPALRERREDIPALVESFISDFNRRHDGRLRGISPEALAHLTERDWPGNVRELRNTIDSAAIMAAGAIIGVDDLETIQPAITRRPSPARARPRVPEGQTDSAGDTISIPALMTLEDAERILIREHLRRAKTKAEAARRLGIGLRTLYTKLRDLDRSGNGTPVAGEPPA
jgi:DNA-binding NtrC family response regulator